MADERAALQGGADGGGKPPARAAFRFYAELNNFLSPSYRRRRFVHPCARDATVKHMIEALGVPHTEVGLILVDGTPALFEYRLQDGDDVSVYPAFTGLDPGPGLSLRPEPGFGWRFIADAHLGLLARRLRMLGFDTLYRNDYDDAEVARISAEEERVALTRDRDLLIRKEIVYGCYLHARGGLAQVAEVLGRYRLANQVRMFSRCMVCNGPLHPVEKGMVAHRVPPRSRAAHEHFHQCGGCGQVYWEGSHTGRMREQMRSLLGGPPYG